jgi:hypothetical protein
LDAYAALARTWAGGLRRGGLMPAGGHLAQRGQHLALVGLHLSPHRGQLPVGAVHWVPAVLSWLRVSDGTLLGGALVPLDPIP